MKTEISLIVAIDSKYGIGKNGTIPWNIKEDQKSFKDLTEKSMIVMGRNTWESLPSKPLKNRTNVVLTREFLDGAQTFVSVSSLLEFIKTTSPSRVFIIGGVEIYRAFVNHCSKVYITQIGKNFDCDTFLPIGDILTEHFELEVFSQKMWSSLEECHFRYLEYRRTDTESQERNYLQLVSRILVDGNIRPDRTGVGTVSLFGEMLKFDISRTVPVLTTKQVPWKSAIKELLWFLRGDTDSKKLSAEGVKVWEANTSREFLDNRGLHDYPEGSVGLLYPHQFRHFGAKYRSDEKGFDQIAYVLDLLKNDPFSRRICMSVWNAAQLSEMALLPCHSCFAQFYVEEINGAKYLSCHVTNRSQDMGLGVAWNIIHYTVLTYIFAKKCGMNPKELTISIGDGHVYSNHIEHLEMQLQRMPRSSPALRLSDSIIDKDFEDISIEDFELIGYYPHKSISMPMAV